MATTMKPTKTGFAGKRGSFWLWLASWFVPFMMALAYVFMAVTAETDTTGKAWMALGFVFVLVLWWIFRVTTKDAALARALSVGDAERILELMPRVTSVKTLGYRALASAMRGAWSEALAYADEAAAPTTGGGRDAGTTAQLASIRVMALVESGDVPAARAVYEQTLAAEPADPRAHDVRRQRQLALGMVTYGERDADAATSALERVTRDVRAGSVDRAIAHAYAARISSDRGDAAGAAKHRTEVARLAPATWMARDGA